MGSTTEIALIGRSTWTRAINHLNNSTENCERVKIATKICSACRLPNKFAKLMLALSKYLRLGCLDPHLTIFASCNFGRKVHHHQSRASRSQLFEKICAALAIYPRFWWESGSTFLDSTHSQAPAGSRIFNPGISGTGFCKIPGSRDFSGRD